MATHEITIQMTPEDFHALGPMASEWGWENWHDQSKRFEPTLTAESLEYGFAYWIEAYVGALIGRSFLESIGEKVSVHWDMGTLSYVLLTNYPFLNWDGVRHND